MSGHDSRTQNLDGDWVCSCGSFLAARGHDSRVERSHGQHVDTIAQRRNPKCEGLAPFNCGNPHLSRTYRAAAAMNVHTYPLGDIVEHDTDGGDCVCGPTTEAVFRDDGTNGWQVIHHSLDGREASR